MCTGYPVGLTVGLMRVKAVGRGWSGFGPSTPSACASSGVAGTVRGGFSERRSVASAGAADGAGDFGRVGMGFFVGGFFVCLDEVIAGAAVGSGVGCVLYAVGYGDV